MADARGLCAVCAAISWGVVSRASFFPALRPRRGMMCATRRERKRGYCAAKPRLRSYARGCSNSSSRGLPLAIREPAPISAALAAPCSAPEKAQKQHGSSRVSFPCRLAGPNVFGARQLAARVVFSIRPFGARFQAPGQDGVVGRLSSNAAALRTHSVLVWNERSTCIGERVPTRAAELANNRQVDSAAR